MTNTVSSLTGLTQPRQFTLGGDFLAFIVPSLLFLEVNIVGRLYVSELILLSCLPILLYTRANMLSAPLPRMFLTLAVAWILAQIFADFVRDTPFVDYSRGWAKISFTIANFCVIYMLIYGNRRRMVLFALGMVAGGLVTYFLGSGIYAEDQPWKFGVGYPLTLLAVVIVTWLPLARKVGLPVAILFCVGSFSFIMGSRGLGAVTILAGFYILVQSLAGRRDVEIIRPSSIRLFIALAGGLLLAYSVMETYEFIAPHGFLGPEAKVIFQRQAAGKFGVLLGGRSEMFASVPAILDRPIVGHGSWAKNPFYAQRILDLRQYGYAYFPLSATEGDLIPTHSHFFGAWVETGIIGAVFWGWVLWLLIRVLANLWSTQEPLSPLVAYTALLLFWDIIFSPFGASRRILNPYYIVLSMFVWDAFRANKTRRRSGDK